MRHLAFLRVYVPLERLPERLHHLAHAAAKLSRADIEAEAAERLNRRLRPNAFSLAPRSTEPPIVRVVEAIDPRGDVRKYFHVDYLERAAFESQYMRRKYFPGELYDRLVPPTVLDRLEKISELQADAKLISRPIPTMRMQLWDVPLAWLAAFTGDPDIYDYQNTTENIVGGTPVIRRVRDFNVAFSQLSWLHRLLDNYGPNTIHHPYRREIVGLHSWLADHQLRQQFGGMLELDYAALSRYAWPDETGKLLAAGHAALEQVYELEDELEDEFFAEQEDDFAVFPGVPPVMLEQAADYMATKYRQAVETMARIQRYEYAN